MPIDEILYYGRKPQYHLENCYCDVCTHHNKLNPPKVIDITERWVELNQTCVDPGDSPNDYFDWKGFRSEGYDRVRIEGVDYKFTKWGPVTE